MALKPNGRNSLVAKIIDNDYGPCSFCHRTVNDEIGYGKLYSIGDIYCHYFCVLLSCCLVQKGQDEEGLLGFLYYDILAEIKRSKKHRCSHCGRGGATLGCAVSKCRRQFHLPCAREHGGVSLYYGNYRSYCKKHAPRQRIDPAVMAKAEPRMAAARKRKALEKSLETNSNLQLTKNDLVMDESVCMICCETVPGFPSTETFWPPCCARDAWFHRSCLERMALSAGQHYLKCPLCNDKQHFYEAVVTQGYYVPDRDAAWELDRNAFREMYEREVVCRATECRCPEGRLYDDENTQWDIKLCLLCGGGGCHVGCLPSSSPVHHVCDDCIPAAPQDLDALEREISKVILVEEPRAPEPRSGPRMSSRMSIRRTKPCVTTPPGRAHRRNEPTTTLETSSNIKSSRLELNIKSPKKRTTLFEPSALKNMENILLSPIKLLEEKLNEKCVDGVNIDSRKVIDALRVKFKRPRPLCAKKQLVNALVLELLSESPDVKLMRSPFKGWRSPKKLDHYVDNVVQSSPKSPQKTLYTPSVTPIKSPPQPRIPTEGPTVLNIDDSSTSTFQLSSELLAERTDTPIKSIYFTDSPKKSKSVDIQKTWNNPNMTPTKMPPALPTDVPTTINIDDSSTSTFQLSPDFIAESSRDDVILITDSPIKSIFFRDNLMKSKNVDIQKDSSMEISEDNEHINIEVFKIDTDYPVKEKVIFSPTNVEVLDKRRSNIDLQCFKNQYLSEVDKSNECIFNHKHDKPIEATPLLSSTIRFAVNAVIDKKSRSKDEYMGKRDKEDARKKNRMRMKIKLKEKRNRRTGNEALKIKLSYKADSISPIKDSTESKKKRKMLRKEKKKLKRELKYGGTQMKINCKNENVENKGDIIKNAHKSTLYQSVLNFSPEQENNFIKRPQTTMTAIKKKKIKQEKGTDNLKQTVLLKFFQKSPTDFK